MATRRTQRVAEAIKRLISEIVHDELRDPRTKGFITITKTEVTPDLRLAKIYYSVLGDDKTKKSVANGLKSAKKFIRKRIADELKMRYVPEVVIKVDQSAEHRAQIDRILTKIRREEKDENNRQDRKDD